MKSIKMLGLAALAALMAMAFMGASSAMATNTQLCKADEATCAAANVVAHIHEETLVGAKAKVLSNLGNIECNALFLGDSLGLGAPLIVHGHFTYTDCKRGVENCTVIETSTDALYKALKVDHETANVTLNVEFKVTCAVIKCTYLWEAAGTRKGPLLSSETNGDVSIQDSAPLATGGMFCPGTNKLDITTTPLEKIYISS